MTLATEFIMMLWGECAGPKTRPVFLTNGRHLFKDVFVFYFQCGNCLNVTFNRNGIARWMGPGGGGGPLPTLLSLRVPLMCRSAHHTVIYDVSKERNAVLICLLFIMCMVCAERKPQDPWFPRLRLVGVYPVQCSWAYINLEDVAGKGQEYDSPLYIVPGPSRASRMHTMTIKIMPSQQRLHISGFVGVRDAAGAASDKLYQTVTVS